MSGSGQERPAPVTVGLAVTGGAVGPRVAWDADGRGRGGGERPVLGVQRDKTRWGAPSGGEVMIEEVKRENLC